VCVVAADWEQFHQTLFQGRPANILNELTREKKQPATLKRQSVRAESHKASARQQLDSASDKRQFLEAHVKAQLMETLGSKEPLDLREGFFDLGMDSLMAMEFQERLQSTLECTLPTTLTFKYPRVEALVDYLAQVILTEKPAARTDTALETARREADALAREVHSLSPQELMAQILEKFEKHQ
jgi:acyl carrier protein